MSKPSGKPATDPEFAAAKKAVVEILKRKFTTTDARGIEVETPIDPELVLKVATCLTKMKAVELKMDEDNFGAGLGDD